MLYAEVETTCPSVLHSSYIRGENEIVPRVLAVSVAINAWLFLNRSS
jgi:hypothetical protein